MLHMFLLLFFSFVFSLLYFWYIFGWNQFCFFFFFSSRRRHTRCREVSWARRCVQETGVFLISIINGVGIGLWLGHRAHVGASIFGGVIGFSMIYSFFITIVETNAIDKVALSEEKYSHFLRTEYLKRFTNTSRASLYNKYSEYIKKKYSTI
eukprot:TRINITY_DN44544_c0_g1_i2.p1 TRINITY_DN44544_c0_g1~~TRINITY_DN44544_c0_g1_i2.p1  ORF type:complete len:152 (+),score=36.73 TRINITY_DN44544_c0_g1_i2:24-479(+)